MVCGNLASENTKMMVAQWCGVWQPSEREYQDDGPASYEYREGAGMYDGVLCQPS